MTNKVIIFLIWTTLSYGHVFGTKLSVMSPMPARITSSSFNRTENTGRVISLLAGMNYGGPFGIGPICTESIRYALDIIKSTPNFLDGYELAVDPYDDLCTPDIGVGRFAELMRQNEEASDRFPLTTGTYCSYDYYTGQWMEYFNFVAITVLSGAGRVHSQRNLYKNYFVMNPPSEASYATLVDFLLVMGWRRIAILGENTKYFTEIENQFIEDFERRNGSVIGVFKFLYFSGTLPESEHVEAAVNDMKLADPRIILIDAIVTSRIACWLHRAGLYGPNYVILIMSPFAFQSNDMLRFWDWCTEQMLSDVLQSVIYFGYTTSMNLDPSLRDSFGVSGTQLEQRILERVENADKIAFWWTWRSMCYDNTMMAAVILNATESILQERNETLSDWVTGGRLFASDRKNEASNTIKQGLYQSRMRAMLGDVHFDSATTRNSRGNVWMGFFQVQNVSEGIFPAPVAIYDNPTHKIHFGPKPFVWRTQSQLPPIDGLRIVKQHVANIPQPAYIAITLICVIETISIVALSVFIVWQRDKKSSVKNSVPELSLLLLIGDLFLELFILIQPSGSHSPNDCMASYSFFFSGILTLLYGLVAKPSIAAAILRIESSRNSSRNLRRRSEMSFRQLIAFEIGEWLCILAIFIVLLGVWFGIQPLNMTEMVDEPEMTKTDLSLAFQFYTYYCGFGPSLVATVIIGLFCSGYAVIVLRGCLMAYNIRSRRFGQIIDVQRLAKCFYLTVILLCCGGVIAGAIFHNDHLKIRITLSCIVLICVALNLGMVFVPMILLRKKPMDFRQNRSPMGRHETSQRTAMRTIYLGGGSGTTIHPTSAFATN